MMNKNFLEKHRIDYRTLERDGICSVCGKDIPKGEEKVFRFITYNATRGYVNICIDCVKELNKIIN